MEMKIKNKSHRYNINIPRFRYGHKFSKYRNYLIMTMLICVKQHLSNIWSSIYEKVKQQWGWVEKNIAYKKKRVVTD